MINTLSCIGLYLTKNYVSICVSEKYKKKGQLVQIKQIPLNKKCFQNNQFDIKEIANCIKKDIYLLTNCNFIVMSSQNTDTLVRCEKIPIQEKNITSYLEKQISPLIANPQFDYYETQKVSKNSLFQTMCYAAISKQTKELFTSLAQELNLTLIGIQHPAIATVTSLMHKQTINHACYIIQTQSLFDIFIVDQHYINFAYSFSHDPLTDMEDFVKKLKMGIHAFYNMYPQNQNITKGVLRLNDSDNSYQENIHKALPDIEWQDNINAYLPTKKTAIQSSDMLQNLAAIGCSLYPFVNTKKFNIGNFNKPLHLGLNKKQKQISLVAACLFSMIILTSGWWLNKQNKILEQNIHQIKDNFPTLNNQQKTIAKNHAKLTRILKNHGQKPLSHVFEQLMLKSPKDILLNDITFDNNQSFTLSGVALKQESIIFLYEELKKQFKNVTLQKIEGSSETPGLEKNAFNINFSLPTE